MHDYLNNLAPHSTKFFNMISEKSAVPLTPSFPFLLTDNMSETEIENWKQKLSNETEKIKSKFTHIMYCLQKSIEKSGKFNDLITFLSLHEKTFEEVLISCVTTSEAFIRIRRYCSFYDYSIMKLLTDKFGTDEDKKRFKKYLHMFQEYSKRRVCECPTSTFGAAEKEEKVLVLKTENKKIDEVTVEEMKALQFQMNQILGRKDLRLLYVDEGCIELTFRVTDDVLDIARERQQELRSLGFTSISYGGHSLDLDVEKTGTPSM